MSAVQTVRGLVVALCLAGTPVLADLPLVPEHCEALYSVQKRLCAVQHVYRCQAQAAVEWLLVDVKKDKSLEMETIDAEGNLLSVWTEKLGKRFFGYVLRADPVSYSTALSSGRDDHNSTFLFKYPVFLDPIPTRSTGHMVRTGETVVLDGVTFERFEAHNTLKFLNVSIEIEGDMFLDVATGAFIDGQKRADVYGMMVEEGHPAQVIHPGEPGFLKNVAIYDCDATSDAAPDRRPA
ncbi:MAG: hypothetical protein KDK24_07765 [Pseudooceanicola sp.]|nr:hypothetical protein [Pseudooceanicola sp.]